MMMKNKFLLGLMALGLSSLIMVSCSKLPQAEIDEAKAAIENARNAGAEMYVQENFILLQDSMNSVMAGIEAKKSKFLKNYSKSIEKLAGVKAFAEQITQQTETRIVEIKSEIQATVAEAQALVESNKNLILEAPRGKEGTSALEAIKQELSAVEAAINEAGAMMESNELLTALDKAKASKDKAKAINTELSEVIAKYKANVMKKRG